MKRRGSRGEVIPAHLQTPEVEAALKEVGTRHNIKPAAIAGVIRTESNWKGNTQTGRYRGLTQIGPENPEYANIKNMSEPEQIRTYGRWLDRYKFSDKTRRAGVDFNQMSSAQQAAYLQGFQFAPNAMEWQKAAGRGETSGRTTKSKQARALGSTSLNDMTRYYGGLLGEEPSARKTKVAAATEGESAAEEDRSEVDRSAGAESKKGTTDVASVATLKVKVKAPAGTKVTAEADKTFKKTEVERTTKPEKAKAEPAPASKSEATAEKSSDKASETKEAA